MVDFKDRKIAVMGTGEAGASAARYLARKGARLYCIDDRPTKEWNHAFVAWCRQNEIQTLESGASCLEEIVKGLDLLVVSPGVSPCHGLVLLARKKGVQVVGELFLAASLWKGPLIGITGTNGKTTTTLLTGHLLKSAEMDAVCAGNISPPLFDCFDENREETAAVLEISSFQLEYFLENPPLYIKRPLFRAAVCLNVAPDHLDRHGSMEDYARAKERLFSFQDENCFAVLGDGAESFEVKARKVFLRDIVLDESEETLTISFESKRQTFDISGWKAEGEHNLKNLAASLVCARALGAQAPLLERGLSSFCIPGHRLERVGKLNGVNFINDSKATNTHAVVTGIKATCGKVVLIAGGRAKGEDFGQLARALFGLRNGDGPKVKGLILIGEAAEELAGSLGPFFKDVAVVRGDSGQEIMDEAVAKALSMADEGESVVLSPACASFDLFSNYKERGEAFKKAFLKVAQGQG